MLELYIAAIVVVVILIIYVLLTWNTSTFEDYFYGFWAAEGDEFCEETEIDSMMMSIGSEETSWGLTGKHYERKCYLIIMNDIDAQGLTLKYSTGWAAISSTTYRIHADVEFEDEQIWPDSVTIDIDMTKGRLHIYGLASDGIKTSYAKLYKNHDISAAAHALEGCDMVD